jgi:hypothetical protein
VFPAEPVCSCAFFYAQAAHETAGAARTRLSLRPLVFRGQRSTQSSGASRRENVESHLFDRIQAASLREALATKQSIYPRVETWIASPARYDGLESFVRPRHSRPCAPLGRPTQEAAFSRMANRSRLARYSLRSAHIFSRISGAADGRRRTFYSQVRAGTGPSHSRSPREL